MAFIRSSLNPLLKPNPSHDWEDMEVFNPGVTFFQNKFYMLYRAIGEYKDYISLVGLAISDNGVDFDRQTEPLLSPQDNYEKYGIEDIRINPLEGIFYLTHTVLGTPATQGGEPHRVGLIKTNDFKDFERVGVITPPEFCSRNAVLFPEKINGRYAMLHRPLYLSRAKHPENPKLPREPGIWISYSDNLIDWKDNELLIEPEFWWEDFKIGGGPPPIKTEKGWLVLYHGVTRFDDVNYIYRAGMMILDLKDPKEVIYRSKEPIFEPTAEYETEGDVPNVVFPTGLVEKNGLLYMYYGAADSTICLATANKNELLSSIELVRENW